MIHIILKQREYEHDAYDLIKAFFHEDKLMVTDDGVLDLEVLKKMKRTHEEDEIRYVFELEAEREVFQIAIYQNGKIGYEDKEAVTTWVKKENHNQWKRFLYRVLTKLTGEELPWGILTGVRPTKIVLNQLEENIDENEIESYMTDEYLCMQDKIDLSLKIAKREIEVLRNCDYQNGYSIYVGIPFCPTICNYCSFASYSLEKHENILDEYLNALEKEIIYAGNSISHKKLTTVYVGGGTPTSLNEQQLERLLQMLRKNLDFSNVCEFTVEAGRPDSITREKLQILKKYQVDRISINPQTMNQKTLDVIGRKHSVDQIRECYQMAREEGHDNINMDMILGLTGETLEDVKYTLEEIGKLSPDSLTVHTLAKKRAADLTINKDKYKDYEQGKVSDMLEESIQFTKMNGYEPYYLYRQKNMRENLENTGYARYGKEGIYNILIMEEKQTILALGAGGLSKFVFHKENRLERVENVKSIRDYIGRIDEMIERKRNFIEQNQKDL